MLLRGLDIRFAFATAKLAARVAHAVDPTEDASGDFFAAVEDAKALGIADYAAGNNDVPHMFKDESYLAAAWLDGFDFAEELADMRNCSVCQSGVPCATHGY